VALGDGVGVELARVGRTTVGRKEDGEHEGVPAAAEHAHSAEEVEHRRQVQSRDCRLEEGNSSF